LAIPKRQIILRKQIWLKHRLNQNGKQNGQLCHIDEGSYRKEILELDCGDVASQSLKIINIALKLKEIKISVF